MRENLLRRLARIEAPAIRTAAAAVVPMVAGQIVGRPDVGVMVGLGGLYVSITEKPGASLRSFLAATVGVAASAGVASLFDQHHGSTIAPIVVIAFAAGMLRAYGEVAGQIGFAMALVFAVGIGLPARPGVAPEHMLEFAAGGLWSTLLTLILWQWCPAEGDPDQPLCGFPGTAETSAGGDPLARLRDELTWRSPVLQHALRFALVVGIATTCYEFLHLERGYWLIITTMVIMKPEFSDTHRRALERVLGSVVGGVLALLLAVAVRNLVALDLLLVLLSVLAYSQLSTHYGLYVVFLTPFVVLMINTASPGDWHVALVRIYDNVAGGALAWMIAYLLRPRGAGEGGTPAASGRI